MGKMLEKLRNEMRHKRVDLEATRKLIWRTAAARLMAALSDAAVDVGEELCHSQTREELSAKILRLNLNELMAETFKEHAGIIAKAVENIVNYVRFAGEHVKNYACLYLAVKEKV